MVKAVTAKLTGTFYVGQSVRVRKGAAFGGYTGEVREIDGTVGVDLGEIVDGEIIWFDADDLEPA